MKLNRIIVAVSVLVIIFGGIFISQKLGWWRSKNSGAGSGRPVIGRTTNSHEDEDHEEGEESRESSEEHEETSYAFEVAGSTTIAQVIEMGLTPEEVESVIGKYESKEQTVKDAASINGLSFGKVKSILNAMINN